MAISLKKAHGDTMHPAFAMILRQLNLHGLGNRPRIIAKPSDIPGIQPELSLSESVLRRLKNAISHKAHQGPREMARRVRQAKRDGITLAPVPAPL